MVANNNVTVDADGRRALLDQHRRDIEALDRRILHLICERLELARQIGELKRACRIPLRNFQVETQVNRRLEAAAEDLGLEATLGRDLAHFLIEKAVEEQASLLDTDYEGDHLEVLVLGGKGGMGRWIARVLAGQGHRVRVFDPSPRESVVAEVRDLATAARDADLIMVAVPMSACAAVLDELASLEVEAVVAEMCSLKQHLAESFSRCRQGGMRLVSFHPLFGPGVRMLSGRTIVFCDEGEAADVEFVRGFFVNTSAELVTMSAAEHDRRMAVILGMTHLANLAFARALMLSELSGGEMAEVAGVTFAKQLATTLEVTEENPELYFQIQALNPSTDATADWLKLAVDEFSAAVGRSDTEGFARLMTSCRDYLRRDGVGEAR